MERLPCRRVAGTQWSQPVNFAARTSGRHAADAAKLHPRRLLSCRMRRMACSSQPCSPHPTLLPVQWHIPKISAMGAWQLTTGSAEVKVRHMLCTRPGGCAESVCRASFLLAAISPHTSADPYGHPAYTALRTC